jgi:glycosyltransferase involved in cell wall biosynthesis
MFFPRGGSAQVARNLAHALPEHGWEVTVVSGSLPGHGDARTFYDGLDVVAVDFSRGDAPQHPSYEDRRGAPDAVFAAIDDVAYERHVRAWAAALERAGAADADVLHLHHLTPINEAAARVAPHVPVVAHLHGTELLMLERIDAGAPAAWPYADAWARRMRRWAQRCARILVLTPSQVESVARLLRVDPEVCVVAPNGFDPDTFARREIDRDALWRRHLVEQPRGWRPGAEEGSIRYTADEVAQIANGTVLISVGRFTEVKRTGLLVRAFELARERFAGPASLVLLGGYPGEWEGEHPYETVLATGARNVFLAGWHGHDRIPDFLSAADALVLASVHEQFGLVLVEGMACGLPVIAVDRYGPSAIVDAGETGWLVEPDDEASLAAALVEAVDLPDERVRRGEAARKVAHERWSWPALAASLAEVLEDAAGIEDERLAGAGDH